MEKILKLKNLELSQDKYYYFCAAGLGDTFLTCGFLKKLKEKLNSDICLLIKKSHKVIMDMYNISDYIIVDYNDIDLKKLSDKSITPQKGKIYLAHPAFHKELWGFFEGIYYQTSTIPFLDWFKTFLGLEDNIELELPEKTPQLSDDFKERLNKIAPLDKIVLFIPDATSMKPLLPSYWKDLAKDLKNQGYYIITNAVNKKDCIEATQYLNMTVEEVVALALNCAKVYSLRNGLCDLIYSKGKDLTVLYPTHNAAYIFSLNKMFKRHDINEQIVLNLTRRNKSIKLFGSIPLFDIERMGLDTKIKVFGHTILKIKDGL